MKTKEYLKKLYYLRKEKEKLIKKLNKLNIELYTLKMEFNLI